MSNLNLLWIGLDPQQRFVAFLMGIGLFLYLISFIPLRCKQNFIASTPNHSKDKINPCGIKCNTVGNFTNCLLCSSDINGNVKQLKNKNEKYGKYPNSIR